MGHNRKTPKWKPIRCARCGLFMGYKDMDHGKCNYAPDTAFTAERIEWLHDRCRRKP